MLGMIGLLGGLFLLTYLIFRGVNIIIVGPICAIFTAALSGMNVYEAVVGTYMQGFVGFFGSFFMIFLMGTIFGKLMEETGAAEAVANAVVEKLGASKAVLAVVLACGILTYGGVSAFVVGFAVYPLAVTLFRGANLPRRFIPGALAFGTITFAMTAPGTPQIHNIIPIATLDTSPMSGLVVGLIVAVVMFAIGQKYLDRVVKNAVDKGEGFVERPSDPKQSSAKGSLPSPLMAGIPLVIVVVALNAFKIPLEVSLLIGVLAGALLMNKYVESKEQVGNSLSTAASSAVTAIANTCAVVGFGRVASSVPAFEVMLGAVTSIPGSPLIGAAVAISVMAGLSGSASGGMAIVMPMVAPTFIARGVIPAALHRVAAISSGALDSLPHNGYVVTTIRAVCGETHKDAYPTVFWLTVALPIFGVALAILLFSLFPFLP